MQKPGVTGKKNCWFVTCSTYTLVRKDYKRKFLWRGRLCHFAFSVALLSHDDDLHPRATLSVQSYEFCDSPSITVIQILVCGVILPILTISVLAPTM